MGVYLSIPETSKVSVKGLGNGVKFGASCMQGWRMSMEDAEICEAEFTENSSLFAVFDGHGGKEVAKYCEKYFGDELKKNSHFKAEGDMTKALTETFLIMDEMMESLDGQKELAEIKGDGTASFAGCTANVILIHKSMIYCANAGDSRTIMWTKNEVAHLSTDHKPEDTIEENRITKAGGYISMGRVNGNLNLSRALGDLEYKKDKSITPGEQVISGVPDVLSWPLSKDDKFLVMGCDGIWELLNADIICRMVNAKIDNCDDLTLLANEILDEGMAPNLATGEGCDNMSCIVIKLNYS
jgi:serine/threonine protein phosphatase PrpC